MAERTATGGTAATGTATPEGVYQLSRGVSLIDRGDDGLQIGIDPPRCLVLKRAPAESAQLLRSLDGRTSLAEVIRQHRADPRIWYDVLPRLVEAGLARSADRPADPDPLLLAEHLELSHRHGPAEADRLLRIRQESTVAVTGSSRVANWVAQLLAGAGVGHVHHRPDRAVHSADLASGPGPTPGSGLSDEAVLAGRLRRQMPTVRVRAPAPQIYPALHILAGDGPADPVAAAELTTAGIPHLQVWAGPGGAVIGPLVLPGRSSCLHCADLHRIEADPFWPRIAADRRVRRMPPATATAVAVAALAVREALDHLEGVRRPDTLDGTLDWSAATGARRRTWAVHPECGCRSAVRDQSPGPM